MSIENRRNEFRKWGLLTVTHETTINGYIESLEIDLPERLNIPSVFNITDIGEIDNLYSKCSRGGDLFQFSRSIGNGRPLASLGKYKKFLQYSFIKEVMQRYMNNPNHFDTNSAYWYFNIVGTDKRYPIKAICREALSILNLSPDFTTNQAKAALKNIFPTNTIRFIDTRENDGEIFYGLWTPRNNQDKIDECLQSGIWYRGDGNFNREEEARKIASMSVGDKVFLYYTSKDVKVQNSAFAQYLPKKYVELGQTIVKAECVSIGKVVSTNTEDLSVTVDWKKDYKGSEWFLYTRQDGVWWFDGKTQDKNKAQALYDIVFNGKEQDYKWWAENGGFNVDTITSTGSNINQNNQIKNIILYGSPGVGKTHNTNKLINLIESGISEKEIFETIKSNEQNNGMDITDIKDRIKFVTFHQSFGYEDFIEGFRPDEEGNIKLTKGIFRLICKDAQENLDDSLMAERVVHKNYYLVIDEINRGNISKVFGELITLIEEDKRDKIEVTLPYSKKTFKVPSNLYIIGTMNSTDKSIALIDIALRRRFTFIKMMPNSDLVPELARDIFIKLNEGITNKLGEDYLIGHSYFMKIQDNDDLEFVLEYKIKPLLEEYFYGDEQSYEEMTAIISNTESNRD